MVDLAKPSSNPLSIKQIQDAKKKKREQTGDKVRIWNTCKSQAVGIQIYGANSKLVPFQQLVQIWPGKHVDLPKNRLMESQIDNLKKRGFIRTAKVTNGKKS
jgi:hypothetical protein